MGEALVVLVCKGIDNKNAQFSKISVPIFNNAAVCIRSNTTVCKRRSLARKEYY